MKFSESELRQVIREKIKHLVMDDAIFKGRDHPGLRQSHDIPGDTDDVGRNLGYGSIQSDDREGDSTKKHLYSLIKNATALYDMIQDDDDLPEWVQSKIAKTSDMMSSVHDYLEYKINRHAER